MDANSLIIEGARQNNLRNIFLLIPHTTRWPQLSASDELRNLS